MYIYFTLLCMPCTERYTDTCLVVCKHLRIPYPFSADPAEHRVRPSAIAETLLPQASCPYPPVHARPPVFRVVSTLPPSTLYLLPLQPSFALLPSLFHFLFTTRASARTHAHTHTPFFLAPSFYPTALLYPTSACLSPYPRQRVFDSPPPAPQITLLTSIRRESFSERHGSVGPYSYLDVATELRTTELRALDRRPPQCTCVGHLTRT